MIQIKQNLDTYNIFDNLEKIISLGMYDLRRKSWKKLEIF